MQNDTSTEIRSPAHMNTEPCLHHVSSLRNGVSMGSGKRLLANQKDVYGTEIEVIVKGQCSQAVVGRMLASVELSQSRGR